MATLYRYSSNICALARAFSALPAGTEAVKLPELPYGYSALEPVISGEIMELHHSKHHNAYVTNYNKALEQWAEAESKQDSLAAPKIASALHFNGGVGSGKCLTLVDVGGHINHSIFWQNLCPEKDAAPCSGKILEAINRDFGSLDALKAQMSADSAAVQGSGWGWLAVKKETGKLFVLTAPNQDTVQHVAPSMEPLLGLDVWEHAYYLQYKNVRPDYLKAIWKVVNWADVAARYDEVLK